MQGWSRNGNLFSQATRDLRESKHWESMMFIIRRVAHISLNLRNSCFQPNNGNNLRVVFVIIARCDGQPISFRDALNVHAWKLLLFYFHFLLFGSFVFFFCFLFLLSHSFAVDRRYTWQDLYNSVFFPFLLQHNGGYEAQPKNVNTISRNKQQHQVKNRLFCFIIIPRYINCISL